MPDERDDDDNEKNTSDWGGECGSNQSASQGYYSVSCKFCLTAVVNYLPWRTVTGKP